MITILEQVDTGILASTAELMDKFYKDHPDYGISPRATEHREGSTIYFAFVNGEGESSRYDYDTTLCAAEHGWKQYDTNQDAWYFGVWYHMDRRISCTYAEGDQSVVVCTTEEAWKAELVKMADFYGDPPPAFRVIHSDGSLTEHFDADARPGGE